MTAKLFARQPASQQKETEAKNGIMNSHVVTAKPFARQPASQQKATEAKKLNNEQPQRDLICNDAVDAKAERQQFRG